MITTIYRSQQPKNVKWHLALCVLFGFFAVTALEHCSCEPKSTGIEKSAVEQTVDAGEQAQASCVNVPDTTFLLAKPRIPEQSHKEKPSSPNLRCTKIKVFGREVSGRERYAAFSGDGKTFVLRGYASGISVWDTKTVKLIKSYDTKELTFYYSGNISHHPTKNHVLLIRRINDDDPELVLFDLDTGRLLRRYDTHCNARGGINWAWESRFIEGGKYILVKGPRGAALYETETGRILRRFSAPSYLMDYNPIHKRLALYRNGTHLWSLWNQKNPEFVFIWPKGVSQIEDTDSLQFTPDGEYLLRGGYKAVHLWNMRGFKIFRIISRITSSQLLFHPSGKFIFSRNDYEDKEVNLYSFPDFTLVQKLPSEAETFHMTISPDGKYFLKTGKLSELWKCE